MKTYYRDDSVWVTLMAIRVDGVVYPIDELGDVWHRRGRATVRVWVRRVLRVLLLALVFATVLRLPNLVFGGTLTVVTTLLVVLVLGQLLFGLVPLLGLPLLPFLDRSYLRGAAVFEIWARWRGREVLLVRVDDVTRFGRIYRAIQRAVEHHDAPPRRRPG